MAKPGKTGLTRIINAYGYSVQGMTAAWKHEAAFRQEVVLSVLGIPLAFVIASSVVELLLLIGSLLLVLIVELLNSAVEAVVDRIGSEHHDLAGQAKDMGSAAVCVSLILLAVVWAAFTAEYFGFDLGGILFS